MLTIEEELLDDDGYPTDYCLNLIKSAKYNQLFDIFDLISSVWWGGEPQINVLDEYKEYKFNTGGWSGNEEIIWALQHNIHFLWTFSWYQSTRGGQYIFRLSKH